MIMARIELSDPLGTPDPLVPVLPIAAGYGATAHAAHQIFTVALTVASHPVVMDANGRIHHVPRKLLRSVATWESTATALLNRRDQVATSILPTTSYA